MVEFNSRTLREDRIDVQFRGEKFIDILKRWKFYCRSYSGGQTGRLMLIISKDAEKLKQEISEEFNKK